MLQNIPLIFLLKYCVNSIIVSAVLFVLVLLYIGQFEIYYSALLLLSFLMVLQLIGEVDFESDDTTFLRKTAINLFLKWCLVISLLLLIGFAFKITDYYSRKLLFIWFLITPILLLATQWMLRYFVNKWSFKEGATYSSVIIGLNDLSIKLANEFKRNPLWGIECKGFFDDRWVERLSTDTVKQSHKKLGRISAAADFVKNHNIQQIYIALPLSSQPRIIALLDEFRDTTASIYFVADIFLFDLIQANISSINGIPIMAICESPFVGLNGLTKRGSDLGLSILILLLILPLMLLIAIGVKLSSPGPVLFKQRRYGLDGKEILVYKFRSMTVMEDGDQVSQVTQSDPRITRFGNFLRKTSLDELPQFINVLQGYMSIVGPRPHAISHNEMYRKLIKGYMVRHKVKPGITGWAQIKGCRGETDTIEKMQKRIDYDLDYLRNWSLFLDIFIIIKTIRLIIKDNNAY